MLDNLPTVYEPQKIEPRVRQTWLEGGCFHAVPADPRETYTIVIPPPNVTGALHGGHALNNTLQDILIRWRRMQGLNTLWMPGTDHAGIATQAVVEKRIFETEKKSRHDLGREELVRRIWEWKEQYGNRIIEQLKLMGCSCDWERTRFTLDEVCARAVRNTFFRLFRDGLIVRGKRLVNWDTHLQTAVADDEVYHETVKGHFYHFKYPVIAPHPGEPEFVEIATTRPETMLGDTAVAVHPEPDVALAKAEADLREQLVAAGEKERPAIQAQLDALAERRRTVLPLLLQLRDMARDGRRVNLPLVDRSIPLIMDEWADPMLGTGAVKITPAHDPNDWEVGQRHKLPVVNVMTPDGKVARIVEPSGSVNPNSHKYEGKKFATEGREQVVADLQVLGLVKGIEERQIELGHSDRSKTPIEPYLSDQWFVRMGDLPPEEASRIEGLRGSTGLAQLAMDAVCQEPHASEDERKRCGKVHFFPARYAKTYLDWLGEKRDWCISRQLWWGHQIPVWSREIKVGELCASCSNRATQLGWLLQLARKLAVVNAEETTGERRWLGIQYENSVAWRELAELAKDRPDTLIRVLICPFPHESLTPEEKQEFSEAANRKRHWIVDANDNQIKKAHTPEDFDFLDDELLWNPIERYAESAGFQRDPDVLDTWFSSALWPHSTLGWPAPNPVLPEADGLLQRYYPGSVLSTAREIITLWVARMVLTGRYNLGQVPFHDVYIHAVIQDAHGRPFKKTLGNGFDPVDIIDFYGADALRYTMAALSTETQDIRMPMKKVKAADGRELQSSERFELGRNFCNKIWNAARFAFMTLGGLDPSSAPNVKDSGSASGAASTQDSRQGVLSPSTLDKLPIEDRWILSRVSRAAVEVQDALARFQFSRGATSARDFFWDSLCDWYLELVKLRIRENKQAAEARAVLAFALDQSIRLLHPFVPHITEGLWTYLNQVAPQRDLPSLGAAPQRKDAEIAKARAAAGLTTWGRGAMPLIVSSYPPAEGWLTLTDSDVEAVFADLQTATRAVREIRQTRNVPPKQTVDVTIRVPAERVASMQREAHVIEELANVGRLTINPQATAPKNAATLVVGDMQIFVHDVIDPAAERQRLEKELAGLDKQIAALTGKLGNAGFVGRAPADVVAAERQRLLDLQTKRETVVATIAKLG